MNNKQQTIVLGGGCFWCTEAIYQDLRGVISVIPGYAGGKFPNPTYEQVCSGKTGHAEVLQVEFDSSIISLEQLLKVFFQIHDPTTLNQQGADIGSQYRSIILYKTTEQQQTALKVISELTSGQFFSHPIVTEVQALTQFHPAENYHINYFQNNLDKPYCQIVINPKLRKFREEFKQLLKNHD